MKTYQPKQNQVKRSWILVDAKDKILGRLATSISMILTGKNKVDYSTHMDMGDYAVVLNSEKVKLTGNKEKSKEYISHSGYPSGLKRTSLRKLREEDPGKILWNAVKGMLPDNRLKDERLKRLKVIVGKENPYEEKFK